MTLNFLLLVWSGLVWGPWTFAADGELVPSLSTPIIVDITPDPKPFWRVKEKAYDKIKNDRAILVSVKTTKMSRQRQEMTMRGGGWIHAPVEFSFTQASQFTNLPKMSSYIKEVQYQAKEDQLFMHTEAFGYHARMKLQVERRQKDSPPQIRFHIIEGVLTGMKGVIGFEDRERRKAEISMTAKYEFEKLPIPAFFAEFGLEIVLQRMAARIREYVEEEYRRHGQQTSH